MNRFVETVLKPGGLLDFNFSLVVRDPFTITIFLLSDLLSFLFKYCLKKSRLPEYLANVLLCAVPRRMSVNLWSRHWLISLGPAMQMDLDHWKEAKAYSNWNERTREFLFLNICCFLFLPFPNHRGRRYYCRILRHKHTGWRSVTLYGSSQCIISCKIAMLKGTGVQNKTRQRNYVRSTVKRSPTYSSKSNWWIAQISIMKRLAQFVILSYIHSFFFA